MREYAIGVVLGVIITLLFRTSLSLDSPSSSHTDVHSAVAVLLQQKPLPPAVADTLLTLVQCPFVTRTNDSGTPLDIPTLPASLTPASQKVRISLQYTDGQQVEWPSGAVFSISKALWGGGEPRPKMFCRGIPWGEAEATRHCYGKQTRCQEFADVTRQVLPLAKKGRFSVETTVLGLGGCGASHEQHLELDATVDLSKVPGSRGALPVYLVSSECSGNAAAVLTTLTREGLRPVCLCNPHFAGAQCEKCAVGFIDYPFCIAPPYFADVVKRVEKPALDYNCPSGLVEYKCDMTKYPLALKQLHAYPGNMAVSGCALAALPWSCELGKQRTKIKSLCTLVTAEFVGNHLLLLFESLRVFAKDIPFVIAVDAQTSATLIPQLKAAMENRGVQIEFLPIVKNRKVAFWFHEKPRVMKKVLEKYENTMWVDADTFLLAPLGDMPAVGVDFGVSVHDPRGWGSGFITTVYGYSNTGVVFAARGTQMLDAWIDTMQRFDRITSRADPQLFQGMEEPYLDQGPVDIILTSVKGGFRLEPHWNVGWWTPDGRLEGTPGRPNWWLLRKQDQIPSRIVLSEGKDALLLDDRPIWFVHSHFIKEEKNYNNLDLHFNTLVYEAVQKADPESLLGKFAPRLARYATHVQRPSPKVVRPTKDSTKFLQSLKDW
eukprot:TRINITY_DN19629_c0_g1_i1.p1 TRINITY_DN19629_c0_g1~~TRINITY_DN19629_c0_g1_i1.p1  ORF type:complete len:660 (+),score=119.43 TRINITY_DN19629_c0_g1_i1:1373-3352(+)